MAKKPTKFETMVKKAEKAGYSGRFSATNLSYKMYGCTSCKKNTAVKLVAKDDSHAVLACVCGWRKRTTNLY